MRKIVTKHDLDIKGYKVIPAGTVFTVVSYNQRFVYVKISDYTTLRLARKGDCTVLY